MSIMKNKGFAIIYNAFRSKAYRDYFKPPRVYHGFKFDINQSNCYNFSSS